MSVTLLVIFTFCSCGALGSPNLWYFPVASYILWAIKNSKIAVQHLYMGRTCDVFFVAFALRALFGRDKPEFPWYVGYAIAYAILIYISYKYVRSIETYKSPDEETKQ